MADREFVGRSWFTCLQKRNIRRVIWLRADTVVDELRTDMWFSHIQTGQLHCLFQRGRVYGSLMQVVATRDADGELVVLATDVSIWVAWEVYQPRWSIECTFSSMKTRGFDLERSAMVIAERLEQLFGLVTLAWVCCLRVDVWRNALKPIPLKSLGRLAVSVVNYGWEDLAQAIRWEETLAETYFGLSRHPFPALGAA